MHVSGYSKGSEEQYFQLKDANQGGAGSDKGRIYLSVRSRVEISCMLGLS
jgi:hypothetical protein